MKQYKLTFLLIMLMSIVGARASAHDFEVANADGKIIYYKITSDATVAVTYRGNFYNSYTHEYTGNVVIPASVTYLYKGKTYSVTSIDTDAFSGCSGLTSVTIPNSVTFIGYCAFLNCSGLTSVTIPNSVTSIGHHAFSGCTGLTSVTIPNSVTSIGNSAFYYCSGLQKVIVPDFDIAAWCGISFESSAANPLSYAHRLYSDENTEIKSLIIPEGVTSISQYAFYGCSGLTSVTIGNSVTSIGNYAFKGCSGLTSVTIPNSLTSIGYNAFDSCSGLQKVIVRDFDIVAWCGISFGSSNANPLSYVHHLYSDENTEITSLVIPEGVTSIGNYAFKGCSGLTSVTIGNNVTSIGYQAFCDCSGLTDSLTIPNSVTSIDKEAFNGCSGLTSVSIGNGLESISEAFTDCTSLTSVMINSNNIVSADRNENSSLKSVFGNQVKNYILGDEVTSIGGYAFYGCIGLISITIPNNVTDIGDNAFNGCSGLISITIPNSVTDIGDNAFSGCSGLTTVTINSNSIVAVTRWEKSLGSVFGNQVENYILGDEVTSIGDYAFRNCSGLTSITIPNSVTSIGTGAFYECSNLQKVIVPDFDIAIWCGFSFNSLYSNPLCYAQHFYSDENTEITSLIIPEGVTSIGNYAFYGYSGLKSITIPNSVTSIGNSAFCGCIGLTSIAIPNSVTSIGNYTFTHCCNLTSISIPNSVTSIGYEAFRNCRGLTSVTIGSGVTSIGNDAFNYCYDLQKVIVPDLAAWCGISFGNESANPLNEAHHLYSDDNTEITDLVIPDGVTSIGYRAFYVCYGLTSVTIPNSVTSIGSCAFKGCTGLTSVTISNSVTSIGYSAFQNCSGLTSVTIPDGVTSIGYCAFYMCIGLTSVTIGSGVTSFGDEAFCCCPLTEVNSLIEEPYNINENVFSSSSYDSALLRVPVGTRKFYKVATGWSNFKNIEEFVESTDVSLLTDAIYANDMKVSKGNYGTLIINLKNEQATNAYSFDLKLPTGVTLATEGGDYFYTLSDRHNGHSAMVNYQSETDVYSVAALSLQSKPLNGNDGTIITLKLNIATDIALDFYPIRIQNAKYSLVTGEGKVSMPETTAVLTVSDFVMGDVNNDGDADIADAVCIVNHVVGKNTPVFIAAAADVNYDGDVDIADAVRIVNLVVGKISALSREEEWSLPEPQ